MSASASSVPLRGVFPVFQTPFRQDESIDWATLDREIDWLLESGSHGIAMAMVSEVLRLATDEREEMAGRVCRRAAPHAPVVISVGAESGRVSERLARHAQEAGAAAVMAIPPFSVPLADDELLRYYDRIFAAVTIPVIVQDASSYVGRPMPISLQARLHRQFAERIYFKPEAQPLGPNLTALREATGLQARVFEGSGGSALCDSYRRGVVGTMPAADMIDALLALWNALESADERRSRQLSVPIISLVSLQTSLDAFLAIEKYLLHKRGVFPNTIVRGPVGFHLDESTRQEVDRLFEMLLRTVRETASGAAT